MSTTDERPRGSIGRRAVVAGAAWSVPTIVATTAAPSFAASVGVCRTYTTAWNTYSRASTSVNVRTGTVSATTTGASLSIGVRSERFGNNVLSTMTGYADQTTYTNIQTAAGGAYNQTALCFANTTNTRGYDNREQITFTFPVAVRGLSFVITNLDKNDGHSDAVAVLPAGYSRSFPGATTGATGAGSVASPFKVTVNGGSNGGYADGVLVDYDDAVIAANTPLTVHYWNDNTTANTIAAIYFSRMTFDVCTGDN